MKTAASTPLAIVALLFAACTSPIHQSGNGGSEQEPTAGSEQPSTANAGDDGDPNNDGDDPTSLPPPVPKCTTDLTAELAPLQVPGLSAGIIKGGKLVCVSVAGVANIEEKRAVTPDTLFAWASVSKTITAVTIMTFFDEGKFKLDDPINTRLSSFQVSVPKCPSKPITFRHLLTHTSSIVESEDDGPYEASYVQGADSPIGLGDFLKSYLVSGGANFNATTNFVAGCPGTQFVYSNVGAGLIGFLAEQMSGAGSGAGGANKSFEQLAQERVFKPLRMNETSFRLKGLDASHIAMPYLRSTSAFKPAGHLGFPTYPDGLIRTSVPQMARFLLMFMQLGELDGTRVLARTTAEEMRRVQFPDIDDTQGLIWTFDGEFPGRPRMLGHNGGDPGTSSNLYFDPADGSGVLLVANGEWREGASDTLMGKLFDEAKAR
jgi:CubicO group peptidase (beta-lactamase class C family)